MTEPSFLPPLVSFDSIDLDELNRCLVAWGHRMGPLNRPMGVGPLHGLMHHGRTVAVAATAGLMAERCSGLGRDQAVELARVCAVRRDLCRVVLRLWREFVFPMLGREWAVSYQDTAHHSGNLYRFDGWQRLGTSHSGTDRRSGRKGRDKVIWGWRLPTSARPSDCLERPPTREAA